jgi:short-subunit dehydrogenase
MQKGFNLILIERDADSIQQLEDTLRKLLPEHNPVIIRAVLNKFDQESINKAVGDFVTFPVKIFVNCKSSKRTTQQKPEDKAEYEARKKALLKESIITTDEQVREIL